MDFLFFFSFSNKIKSLKILFVVHQMSHKNVFKIRTKEKKEKVYSTNERTKKARRRYVLDRSEKKKEHYTHTHTHIHIYIYIISSLSSFKT